MCINQNPDTFVQIHKLLALAGAGDLAAIEQWLTLGAAATQSHTEKLLEQMALALHDHVRGAFQEAAERLQTIQPQLSQIGGSKAQLQLFEEVEHHFWQRAVRSEQTEPYLLAA